MSSSKSPRGLFACFNARLIYSCGLIALSQLNFGMDQSAFSNTQAMPAFQRTFGQYNAVTKKYTLETMFLSLLNSVIFIGFVFGLVTGNLISRRFGRRIAMFVMCFWALLSAVILILSKTPTQAITGRTIAYVYIGMELALVPVLQSELVPAEARGFVVGTYQSGLMFGSLIMSIICRATSEIPGNASWRIPYGLFFIIPTLLAVGVWWIPESPRWLLTRDRHEEALRSLRLLRQGAYTEDDILEELKSMQQSLGATVKKGQFMDMFRGTNLKRTGITLGVNVFLQLTGQNFSSKYGTIFIQSLGTVNPFVMACINSALGITAVFFTQFMTDRVGRVPLLIAGASVQTAALMTMGGLGTVANPSYGIRTGIVATMTLFSIGFCLGWAPLSHVVAAEIPTTGLRDLTYALGSVVNIVIQWAVAFSVPFLINDSHAGLGSKVGFIFGVTSFMAIIFSVFCIPDCGGKTLEEIDELFIRGVAIRDFRKADVSLRDGSEAGEDLKITRSKDYVNESTQAV
ncbi:general substrate transporter [Plectosphaerella cucumerina]|uniref:General substrate transporter n=1 Tax=Plectosphaerella cucumerina TaxID=40658 RepID=A0A8K0T472_9PEZI|nr:general substrate transporter [Plectosphaerella cucumerina]